MRRWAALALVLAASGCTNAPLAEFLDIVHPIHVRQTAPPPEPLVPNPNVPVIPPPQPPPDPPPSGQLLPPAPVTPGSPPLPAGPTSGGFTPPSAPNNGPRPLSIPN